MDETACQNVVEESSLGMNIVLVTSWWHEEVVAAVVTEEVSMMRRMSPVDPRGVSTAAT